jgi:hypothetical protein
MALRQHHSLIVRLQLNHKLQIRECALARAVGAHFARSALSKADDALLRELNEVQLR